MEAVESVRKCCVVQHNCLIADSLSDGGNDYFSNSFVDQEVQSKRKNGEWRLVFENDCGFVLIHRIGFHSYSKDAKM